MCQNFDSQISSTRFYQSINVLKRHFTKYSFCVCTSKIFSIFYEENDTFNKILNEKHSVFSTRSPHLLAQIFLRNFTFSVDLFSFLWNGQLPNFSYFTISSKYYIFVQHVLGVFKSYFFVKVVFLVQHFLMFLVIFNKSL